MLGLTKIYETKTHEAGHVYCKKVFLKLKLRVLIENSHVFKKTIVLK